MTLEAIKWIKSICSRNNVHIATIQRAARQGFLPIVIWGIRERGSTKETIFDVLISAVKGNKLNVLMWIEGAYPEIFNEYKKAVVYSFFANSDEAYTYLRR